MHQNVDCRVDTNLNVFTPCESATSLTLCYHPITALHGCIVFSVYSAVDNEFYLHVNLFVFIWLLWSLWADWPTYRDVCASLSVPTCAYSNSNNTSGGQLVQRSYSARSLHRAPNVARHKCWWSHVQCLLLRAWCWCSPCFKLPVKSLIPWKYSFCSHFTRLLHIHKCQCSAVYYHGVQFGKVFVLSDSFQNEFVLL